MSDIVPFVLIVAAVGVVGVVIGILVAPLVGRMAGDEESEAGESEAEVD